MSLGFANAFNIFCDKCGVSKVFENPFCKLPLEPSAFASSKLILSHGRANLAFRHVLAPFTTITGTFQRSLWCVVPHLPPVPSALVRLKLVLSQEGALKMCTF